MNYRFPIGILIIYWLFVLKIGPMFMKNRKPYHMKDIMLIYNLYQVIFSTALIYYGFQIENSVEWLGNFGCTVTDGPEPSSDIIRMTYNCSWLYFFNKIVELLDTVNLCAFLFKFQFL